MSFAGAPSGDCTVGFWWRASALDQQYDALYWSGDATAGGNAYDNSVMIVLGNPANNMEIWARNSTAARVGPFGPPGGGAFATNTWYYIALTYNTGNGGALEAFVNAVSAGTGTAGSAGAFQTERTELGNDANSDNSPNSRFHAWKVWNRILTAAEIAAEMYSILPAGANSLWGCWSLNDDSGGLHDLSGNGRNLTETGTLTVEANDSGVTFEAPMSLGGWNVTASAGASITGTGALALGVPTVAGAGVRGSRGTGNLIVTRPATAGSGIRGARGSGALNSPVSTVNVTARRGEITEGDLIAPLPVVNGTGTVTGGAEMIDGDGALISTLPVIAGVAVRGIRGSGALVMPLPEVDGETGPRELTATGALVINRPQVIGTGIRGIVGSGALTGPRAFVNGTGAGAGRQDPFQHMAARKWAHEKAIRYAHGYYKVWQANS